MSNAIRWGIVGTGRIAHAFARDLRLLDDARLVAVASRQREKADAFGDEFSVTHRHQGVASLAADPNIDIVYIGTPHAAHVGDTLACLEGGKAVLCEKPFAINAAEAATMVDRARDQGLFLMEAMWMYCMPAVLKALALVRDGAIGEVRLLEANFGFQGTATLHTDS